MRPVSYGFRLSNFPSLQRRHNVREADDVRILAPSSRTAGMEKPQYRWEYMLKSLCYGKWLEHFLAIGSS